MLGVPPFWNKEKVQPFVGKRVIVNYWYARVVGGERSITGRLTSADDTEIVIARSSATPRMLTGYPPLPISYDKISTIVEDTSTATTQAGLLGNPWALAAIVLGGALLYNYSKNPKRAE
jgi:hypothetical protein